MGGQNAPMLSGLTLFEAGLSLLAVATALWLQPWRGARGGDLQWPWLLLWVLLPVLWSLERVTGTVAVQPLSCISLLVLMAGWPLAILGLPVVWLIIWGLGLQSPELALHHVVWLGVVPATLALGSGALVRRFLPHHLMVYIFGRGFLATWLSAGLGGVAAMLLRPPGGGLSSDDYLIARILAAFGEALTTGMIVSLFVAFLPEWLATYTDRLYLPKA